ncbi:hypothetical protein Hanom_Chr13g01226631 [Helianthus anomalus]
MLWCREYCVSEIMCQWHTYSTSTPRYSHVAGPLDMVKGNNLLRTPKMQHPNGDVFDYENTSANVEAAKEWRERRDEFGKKVGRLFLKGKLSNLHWMAIEFWLLEQPQVRCYYQSHVKGCGEASCDSIFSSLMQRYMLGVMSVCLSVLAGFIQNS